MKIVVIGASGHVGSYLVPRLVRAGHEVIAVTRGQRAPYHDDPAWDAAERVVIDREARDADGTFGATIATLGADVVVDLICFTEDSARQLVDALRGKVSLLVHVGTIWVHGTPVQVPTTEDDPRHPFGDYGIAKAAIERMLHAETRNGGLAATIVHPGHISGPGWPIINPLGNLDLGVWMALATGQRLVMPSLGLEALHHVHADDVAQLIELAIANPRGGGRRELPRGLRSRPHDARLRRGGRRVVRPHAPISSSFRSSSSRRRRHRSWRARPGSTSSAAVR